MTLAKILVPARRPSLVVVVAVARSLSTFSAAGSPVSPFSPVSACSAPRTPPTMRMPHYYTTASSTKSGDAADIRDERPAVKIVEVGPRDGLQNEKTPVPLQTKLALIQKLSGTGLRHIEAGSFVSPKWVPQMADTSTILTHLDTHAPPSSAGEVTYSYLIPNAFGLDAFLSAPTLPYPSAPAVHENEIAVFASASEGFSQKNLNCSIAESLSRFRPVVSRALDHGFRVRGYVSMVIACPYDGATPPSRVADVVESLLAMGCYEISLGDTNGVGTPGTVAALLRYLVQERGIDVAVLAAHLHDTFGMAVANALAAFQMGVRVFDASVAGLGGCPYAKGATGNVATEDLVYCLEGSGCRTGVDLEKLVEAGEWISKELGRENGSSVGKALAALKGGRL